LSAASETAGEPILDCAVCHTIRSGSGNLDAENKRKWSHMSKRVIVGIVCFSWIFCLPVRADPKDEELSVLKEQVKQLRSENQALRLQLGQGGASARPEQPSAPAAETEPRVAKVRQAAPSSQQAETAFWITNSSRKRHNSSCRYYKNSGGRACAKDEGIPCKICGG
jgi:hypothetical protein